MEKKAHVNGNSKKVRCTTTGVLYESMTLAAIENGVSVSCMSQAVDRGYMCNGKEFTLESDTKQTIEKMSKRIQAISKDAEDAQKWREYQTQQEATRRAELKRREEIAKTEEKLARRKEICERMADELRRAIERMAETESELNALKEAGEEAVA